MQERRLPSAWRAKEFYVHTYLGSAGSSPRFMKRDFSRSLVKFPSNWASFWTHVSVVLESDPSLMLAQSRLMAGEPWGLSRCLCDKVSQALLAHHNTSTLACEV